VIERFGTLTTPPLIATLRWKLASVMFAPVASQMRSARPAVSGAGSAKAFAASFWWLRAAETVTQTTSPPVNCRPSRTV
jgi:hypothetical protein